MPPVKRDNLTSQTTIVYWIGAFQPA